MTCMHGHRHMHMGTYGIYGVMMAPSKDGQHLAKVSQHSTCARIHKRVWGCMHTQAHSTLTSGLVEDALSRMSSMMFAVNTGEAAMQALRPSTSSPLPTPAQPHMSMERGREQGMHTPEGVGLGVVMG